MFISKIIFIINHVSVERESLIANSLIVIIYTKRKPDKATEKRPCQVFS